MTTIVSTAEIAARLGVKTATVHVWRQRHPDFPAPDWDLAVGPVWTWDTIKDWALETGRLPIEKAPRH